MPPEADWRQAAGLAPHEFCRGTASPIPNNPEYSIWLHALKKIPAIMEPSDAGGWRVLMAGEVSPSYPHRCFAAVYFPERFKSTPNWSFMPTGEISHRRFRVGGIKRVQYRTADPAGLGDSPCEYRPLDRKDPFLHWPDRSPRKGESKNSIRDHIRGTPAVVDALTCQECEERDHE